MSFNYDVSNVETNKQLQQELEIVSNISPYLDLLKEEKLTKLRKMRLGNHEYLINPNLGYYPYLSIEWRQRVKQKKVINCAFTGEAGLGKSYECMDVFRTLAPKTFGVDDIVFNYIDFLQCVVTSPRGTPIEFDEPSYAMSKKDWFKELNKALVKTIESFRFKGKPLGIPIINKELLEKDVRSYLIQYQFVMSDRGEANVYRLYPSQFQSKTYRYLITELIYKLFDNNLCDKESCLDCKKLNPRDVSNRCKIFRSRYERKKMNVQDKRYEDDLQEAKNLDADSMSYDELEVIAMNYFDKFYDEDKNKLDVDMLATVLWKEERIDLGHNKKYRLAKQIIYDNPKLFEPKPPIHKDNVEKVTKEKAEKETLSEIERDYKEIKKIDEKQN